VEQARAYARSVGLNPRDIHLKNVIYQDGHAKIIDVSEYLLPGDDGRWDLLVKGYHSLYFLIEGRKVPRFLMELVKKGYEVYKKKTCLFKKFKRRFARML
jgi:hypothetical protein